MSLLSIRDLRVSLPVSGEHRTVLRGIDLDVAAGDSVAVVGESGSGKSMTARTITRILPAGARTSGSVTFDGQEVLGLKDRALRRYQSREVAMIFQDPRVHMNPVRSIGDFLTESLVHLQRTPRRVAETRAIELLADVGIPDGARRLRQYPHELSGGLLQRVMIAAALAAEPRLLLADEPTTALDVSTQSEVTAILTRLCRERGMALLFITHDLELAAAVCDRTAVMYAGQIVEIRGSADLLTRPRHPYSAALLAAKPDVDRRVELLNAIPGRPRAAFEVSTGCGFADRCPFAQDRCRTIEPRLERVDRGSARCLRVDELQLSPLGGAS